MKNKLGYLGLLGIVGLVGLYWGSFTHTIFLLFFFFFAFRNTVPDELFKENMKNAALKTVILNLTLNILIMAWSTFVSNTEQLAEIQVDFVTVIAGFQILTFCLSIMMFVFTLMYYTYKESKGLE